MKSLCDIVPLSETIILRQNMPEDERVALTVRGLDIPDVAALLWRFPELKTAIEAGKIDGESLVQLSATAVNAIIAASVGKLGDPASEKGASSLALAEKIEVLTAAIRLTMPNGPGPFLSLVRVLGLTNETSKAAEASSKPLRTKRSG